MLSLNKKVGLLVAGTCLPGVTIVWLVSGGDSAPAGRSAETPAAALKAASPLSSFGTALTPRIILPKPLSVKVPAPGAAAKPEEPTVEEQAMDALDELPFGSTSAELAASGSPLDSWNKGTYNPFGELPLFLDFSGLGGGLSEASTTLSPEAVQRLRPRWGTSRRVTADRTLFFPKPGVRYDLRFALPGQQGQDFFAQPQPPFQEFMPGRGRLGLTLAELIGKDIDDVARQFGPAMVDVGEATAQVMLPVNEFSIEKTLVTLHHRNRTVVHVTVDLVEDVKPGLAATTRKLLTETFGQAHTERAPDDVVVTTYVSARPPVQTLEFGGGERVRLEIGPPLPPTFSMPMPRMFASAGVR